MHQKRNSLDRREERRRWLRRSSVWWGRRPAAKRSWVSCWQSGMTGKWFPPTPCRFTRGMTIGTAAPHRRGDGGRAPSHDCRGRPGGTVVRRPVRPGGRPHRGRHSAAGESGPSWWAALGCGWMRWCRAGPSPAATPAALSAGSSRPSWPGRASARFWRSCGRWTRRRRNASIRRMRSASSGRWRSTGRRERPSPPTTRRQRDLPPRYDAVWIGLQFRDRADMKTLIDRRVDAMVAAGLLEEVGQLLESGLPREATALQAIGYKEFLGVLDGTATVEEAVAEVKLRSRQYAKRQLTWLRRNPDIHWIWWGKRPGFCPGPPGFDGNPGRRWRILAVSGRETGNRPTHTEKKERTYMQTKSEFTGPVSPPGQTGQAARHHVSDERLPDAGHHRGV